MQKNKNKEEMGEGSPYSKGTSPFFEKSFCFMQNICKIVCCFILEFWIVLVFLLEFIKTSKADCCVVVVGLLADKLVNPTSVSLCTVKNNKFKSFVKLSNYKNRFLHIRCESYSSLFYQINKS